jgi:hypothetical protein
MNNNMSLVQLAHYNIHFFVTAIVYQIGLILPKVQALVVQGVEVQLRDLELVEV